MKLELHPQPKQPIQLNRPLILTLVVAVAVVLLIVIISALTVTKRVKTSTLPPPKIAPDKAIIMPELKNLPETYSDIDAIKKYIPDASVAQMATLLKQFNELQNEYVLLKQQLLAKAPPSKEKPFDDPQTQQAKLSSLTFSGVGSKMDSMVGPEDKMRAFPPVDSKDSKEIPNASPQQEEFFKKQAYNAQKLATMKGKDNPDDIYDMHNLIKPASKYQIQAGTLISATLITGIDTTLAGTLIAQVRSNLYDTVTGKYLLIPKGSKLLGEYEMRVHPGQRRVLLYFNRIIRPDGSSILLGKPFGVDAAGQSGLPGNVDNHWARIIGAATISTILNVGAGIGADMGSSTQSQYPRTRERAFIGGAQGITQFGQNIANRSLDIPPTITLSPGLEFNVIVRRDMIVPPYNSRR